MTSSGFPGSRPSPTTRPPDSSFAWQRGYRSDSRAPGVPSRASQPRRDRAQVDTSALSPNVGDDAPPNTLVAQSPGLHWATAELTEPIARLLVAGSCPA